MAELSELRLTPRLPCWWKPYVYGCAVLVHLGCRGITAEKVTQRILRHTQIEIRN